MVGEQFQRRRETNISSCMFVQMLSGGTKEKQKPMELTMLKNPKAKLMMEEAMRLAGKALEVEAGRQRCKLCHLEVLGGDLVEHYTSHYSLEQPGLLVKALVAKNTKTSLRCPLSTCDNKEMEATELDLHIATQHGILKSVMEDDARLPEKKLLFPSELDVWAIGEDGNSLLDPKVDQENKIGEDGMENLEPTEQCEDGEIEYENSENSDKTENTKDHIMKMFQDAKSVDMIQPTFLKEEEEENEMKPKKRKVKTESPSEWSEKRRQREETVKEALGQIATGTIILIITIIIIIIIDRHSVQGCSKEVRSLEEPSCQASEGAGHKGLGPSAIRSPVKGDVQGGRKQVCRKFTQAVQRAGPTAPVANPQGSPSETPPESGQGKPISTDWF